MIFIFKQFFHAHKFSDDNGQHLYDANKGPVDNSGFCPYAYDATWEKGGKGHFATCPNGKCNVKFAGKCHNNLFNKVSLYFYLYGNQFLVKNIEFLTFILSIKTKKLSGLHRCLQMARIPPTFTDD